MLILAGLIMLPSNRSFNKHNESPHENKQHREQWLFEENTKCLRIFLRNMQHLNHNSDYKLEGYPSLACCWKHKSKAFKLALMWSIESVESWRNWRMLFYRNQYNIWRSHEEMLVGESRRNCFENCDDDIGKLRNFVHFNVLYLIFYVIIFCVFLRN